MYVCITESVYALYITCLHNIMYICIQSKVLLTVKSWYLENHAFYIPEPAEKAPLQYCVLRRSSKAMCCICVCELGGGQWKEMCGLLRLSRPLLTLFEA